MEEELHRRVVGQEEAVSAVSRAIRRARSGLKGVSRPIGSFIFLGPTGVGKTELARALAASLFDSEDALIRVDMSEYMERFSSSRLVGSPPGYVGYEEGGQLTEKVYRRPYSVVLFDEIEKAHPDVFNLLLQVLDDGFLTDGLGRRVDFRNTVLVMTSNVGTRLAGKAGGLGFHSSETYDLVEAMRETVATELKRLFSPEFLNRVDETIIFHPLAKDHLERILDILLLEVGKRLGEVGLQLMITLEGKRFLVEKGFDALMGARPMRRCIQKYIEDPLSDEIIRGRFKTCKRVRAVLQDGTFTFEEDAVLATTG